MKFKMITLLVVFKSKEVETRDQVGVIFPSAFFKAIAIAKFNSFATISFGFVTPPYSCCQAKKK